MSNAIRRFIITHIGEDGVSILSIAALADDVRGFVVDDLMASDARKDISEEDRQHVFTALASFEGVWDPPFPEQVTLCHRTYRVEELPDDPLALDEFLTVRLSSPRLLSLVCRLAGRLRYEIWPNESQHRGRPHCKVSYAGKSATFTIPEGGMLAGDIRPYETEARRTIRTHADALLADWNRMRPDDQKLP